MRLEMRFFLVLATMLCIGVGGCSAVAPTQAAAGPTGPQGNPTAVPARATATDGPFQLVFELPQTAWHSTDSIEGQATLSLMGTGGIDLGGSGGGLFGFDFLEVGGQLRHVEPAQTADCRTYRLDAGQPIVSTIKKSGGYIPGQPGSDFYESFLTGPLVQLPAGDWKITAIASFLEGGGCEGAAHNFSATILIHVAN